MTSLLNKHQTWSQQLSDDNHLTATNEDEEENTSSTAPVRKRTRATADQLSVLEDTFAVNVSPNSKLRKQLAEQLQMSERSIQIWFQNRRAKVKHMQKRAQMQMHQASIRAQLYQYHQQQQQQQQHHHHSQPQTSILPMQPYQHPYYYNTAARLAIPRAQSVDAVQHFNHSRQVQAPPVMQQPQHMFTPASSVPPHSSYSATPPPMSYPQYYQGNWLPNSMEHHDMPLARQSMPPQAYPYDFSSMEQHNLSGLDFPEYLHGQVSPSSSPLNKQQQKQNIPTLISVPDAGPTAVLATSNENAKSDRSPSLVSVHSAHESSPESTSVQQQTVNPSNLMMQQQQVLNSSNTKEDQLVVKSETSLKDQQEQPQADDEEPKDLYLSATTLTIGTWHRLKMHETDLVCVYRPDTRTFAWHIVDGGCHFKMEVAQDAVSSIEFVLDENEALADVHFDISEPPLFYMESTTTTTTTTSNDENNKKKAKKGTSNKEEEPEAATTTTTTSPVWLQCSDFTEGKQASRFFRHTLKGISHHMKQELLALIHNHEETRRLVQFIETPIMTVPTNLYHSIPPPPPPHLMSQQPHIHPEDHQLLMQGGGAAFMNPNTMYWNPNQQPLVDTMPCELYMS